MHSRTSNELLKFKVRDKFEEKLVCDSRQNGRSIQHKTTTPQHYTEIKLIQVKTRITQVPQLWRKTVLWYGTSDEFCGKFLTVQTDLEASTELYTNDTVNIRTVTTVIKILLWKDKNMPKQLHDYEATEKL